MTERERRARSAARAEIAALVASAAVTAGDGRGMPAAVASMAEFVVGGAGDQAAIGDQLVARPAGPGK